MIKPVYLTFNVKWSSQLEELADALLHCWLDTVRQNPAPFGKICIVVNDSSTGNWLKQYFLSHCKKVIMNLEFVRLPEFINDWLAAGLHQMSPRERRASAHPYSSDVLTWRIYGLLSKERPHEDLKELLEYIGEDKKHLRRFALSERLAILYDDYLNSRGQMLRNWEKGVLMGAEKIPFWQTSLYQQLVMEDNHTYAADYENVFSAGFDANRAFEYGFPRYLAVHVFDIPFMPETTLHLLEKISEAFPEKMTFWHFNPCSDWLGDSDSKKEAVRRIRNLLQKGEIPSDKNIADTLKTAYGSPKEQLLGALASGARAMIYNLCNDAEGRVDTIGSKEAMDDLKNRKIFLNRCYSPRRELEVMKNGLLQFFDENKEVHPHDIAVLCADWENYAPIIESVFSADPGAEGYIPVTVAGKTIESTPFIQSFHNLLSFRENRFAAGDVFLLLDFPAIRKKYDLENEEAISVLRDMVNQANIRWGYDDDDVNKILGVDQYSDHYPFTWQRGMDRITAEMFHGFNDDEYTLINAGNEIGEIRPCGFVEGERVKYAASLWKLISDLKWLRNTFSEERESAPDEMKEDLLSTVHRFYNENDETILTEVNRINKAICNTAENIKKAGITQIGTEVFLASVLSVLTGVVPGMKVCGDSILFAPLNCSNAVPRKLIWICGLNDGTFPKMEYRASYDLIGKHPSVFDVTSREKDAFALLKAVLCARKQLCLSYVGMDNRSNDNLPPSVLLTDLKDYFSAEGILYKEYVHPMYSYSQRYFTKGSGLPPSYSIVSEYIMKELKEKHKEDGITPFPLTENSETDIHLDQLVDFFSSPNLYLFRCRGIYVSESQYEQVNSRDCLEVRLDKRLINEIVLTGNKHITAAKSQVETGNAPDQRPAEKEIESWGSEYNRPFYFNKKSPCNCESVTLAKAFCLFEKEKTQKSIVKLNVQEHTVCLHQQYAVLELSCAGGKRKFMIFYDFYNKYQSAKNKMLLRYLAGNAAEGEINAVLFGPSGKSMLLPELSKEEAQKMIGDVIALAGTPLPAGIPDYKKTSPKDDVLPEKWQAKLDDLLNMTKGEKGK